MATRLIQLLGLGFLAAIGLGATSCVVATPNHVAVTSPDVEGTIIYSDESRPGPDIREYYYYPGPDVYYDPTIRVYYWNESGNWRHGRDLPRHYRINERDRYRFRSDVREPYRINDRVRRDWESHRGRPDVGRDGDRDRRDYDRGRMDRDRGRPDYQRRDDIDRTKPDRGETYRGGEYREYERTRERTR